MVSYRQLSAGGDANQTYKFVRISFTILIVEMDFPRYRFIQTSFGRALAIWRTNRSSEISERSWA
jgi:hypothetical protein